jgi:hypothetical protein
MIDMDGFLKNGRQSDLKISGAVGDGWLRKEIGGYESER